MIHVHDSNIDLKLHTLNFDPLVVVGVLLFYNLGGQIGRLKAQSPPIICSHMHK